MIAPNARSLVRTSRSISSSILAALLVACSGGGSTPPPPPPPSTTSSSTTTATVPQGQALVSVSATSTPPGAAVTGGGRFLGTTPFVAQVPVPVAAPGETQTFQFTFQLAGYQPATLAASPLNGTITINAALAPVVAGSSTGNGANSGGGTTAPPTGTPEGGGASEQAGSTFTVRGPAGGAIVDMRTTTSTIRVAQRCTIGSLSVDVDGNHSYFSDLVVSVRGPDREAYTLQSHASRNPFRRHSVRRAAGHPSQGEWVLSVADTVGADSGNLRGWSMTVRCR